MMTAKEDEILKNYSALMTEVKQRLLSAHALLHQPQSFPQGMVKEFCYLQLRMICELVALGCLVAHGGIKGAQTGYLKKAYAADRIVDELEKLHQHFFPGAVKIDTGPDGKISGLSEPSHESMTKEELIHLYGLCGAVLHRGNIQRFLSKKAIPNTNKPATEKWLNKLILLLENHVTVFADHDRLILCRVGFNGPFPTTALFFKVNP